MNLPGYDEWKTRDPYEYPSAAAEAEAEIRSLQEENDRLVNALVECLDWLDDHMHGGGELANTIRKALSK